jgi:hypothetical protein
MAFGLIDTSYIDWPANVDATYLRGLETRSGLQFPTSHDAWMRHGRRQRRRR